MASLDPVSAALAPPEGDPEPDDRGPDHRDLGLVLVGHALDLHRPAAGGARMREQGLQDFVHVRRDRPVHRAAIGGAGAATGGPRSPRRVAPGKRRGLTLRAAPGLLQEPFQTGDPLAQPALFADQPCAAGAPARPGPSHAGGRRPRGPSGSTQRRRISTRLMAEICSTTRHQR